MFLCKLLPWGIITLNLICVLSGWHELPVPNSEVLAVYLLIRNSSAARISFPVLVFAVRGASHNLIFGKSLKIGFL